jgi:hypothetical protein
MRKRKVIAIIVVVVLAATLGVFLLTQDSGPPVVVRGNFSTMDIAEIKRAVRRQLWHEVLPNLSKQSIKAFPRMAKRAFAVRLVGVESWGTMTLNGSDKVILLARAKLSGNSGQKFYLLTNGPIGWSNYVPQLYTGPPWDK